MTHIRIDPHGVWAERLVTRGERAATAFDSACARSAAAFWGIELGERCVFIGRPILRRNRYSEIRIGDRCVFRSAPWSNRVGVNRPCTISTVAREASLSIGRLCGFSGTVVAAAREIVIGDCVLSGANVTITDTDWHGLQPAARDQPGESAPVHIGDNVWLGLNVIVLKGVTIGEDSLIAAGSVVTESIPGGVIAAGNPARVIREL